MGNNIVENVWNIINTKEYCDEVEKRIKTELMDESIFEDKKTVGEIAEIIANVGKIYPLPISINETIESIKLQAFITELNKRNYNLESLIEEDINIYFESKIKPMSDSKNLTEIAERIKFIENYLDSQKQQKTL